jgi:hypothetical protein
LRSTSISRAVETGLSGSRGRCQRFTALCGRLGHAEFRGGEVDCSSLRCAERKLVSPGGPGSRGAPGSARSRSVGKWREMPCGGQCRTGGGHGGERRPCPYSRPAAPGALFPGPPGLKARSGSRGIGSGYCDERDSSTPSPAVRPGSNPECCAHSHPKRQTTCS